MTPAETVILVRYIAACCPQQRIDSYTPDAWHDVLGDLQLADCRDAVRALAQTQPFVAASEIRAKVCEKYAGHLPHSTACRGKSHRECVWSWCECICHRNTSIAPPATTAIEA
jgi:hypothetical protein